MNTSLAVLSDPERASRNGIRIKIPVEIKITYVTILLGIDLTMLLFEAT